MSARALPPIGTLVIDDADYPRSTGRVVTPTPAERAAGAEELLSDLDLCVLVEWRPFPTHRAGGRRWEYGEDLMPAPTRGAGGPCTHCACSDADCAASQAKTGRLCCLACGSFDTHPKEI